MKRKIKNKTIEHIESQLFIFFLARQKQKENNRLNHDSLDLPDKHDLKAQREKNHHNQTNPKNHSTDYVNIPGFCKSATIEDIRKNNYILTPGRYIEFKEVEEDEQAFEEKMRQLTASLKKQMQKAKELDEAIKENLKKIGYEL